MELHAISRKTIIPTSQRARVISTQLSVMHFEQPCNSRMCHRLDALGTKIKVCKFLRR